MSFDSSHTFTLTVDGTNIWTYLVRGSLRHTDAEGSEIDKLVFEVEDYTETFAPSAYDEVIWTADGADKLFGGYATSVQPRLGPSGQRLIWTINADSYKVILAKSKRIRKSWENTAAGTILDETFTAASIAGFDTSTHVSAGDTLETFNAGGEKVNSIVDLLAQICGYTWWIDADKNVHFGPDDTVSAPYDVNNDDPDYSSDYPALDGTLTKEEDASDIRNRITVRGGSKISDTQT